MLVNSKLVCLLPVKTCRTSSLEMIRFYNQFFGDGEKLCKLEQSCANANH